MSREEAGLGEPASKTPRDAEAELVPHTRTRTRPEVKWLANELAAVKGELERIEEALARLHARKSKLLVVQVALSDVAGQLTIPELPTVVPAVRAHERYGARGNMRNLLRGILRKAYPQGVSTSTLADAVIETFGLRITGPKERKRLVDNSIRSALTKLHTQGEIEPIHARNQPGGRLGLAVQSGVWRWKVDAPSLEELHRSTTEQGADTARLEQLALAEAEVDASECRVAQEGELWR